MVVISCFTVHIREATSSSLVAPIFLMPWSGDQGFFVSESEPTQVVELLFVKPFPFAQSRACKMQLPAGALKCC